MNTHKTPVSNTIRQQDYQILFALKKDANAEQWTAHCAGLLLIPNLVYYYSQTKRYLPR